MSQFDLLVLWNAAVILNQVIFKPLPRIDIFRIFCEIALRWMPQNLTDD